MRAGGVVCVQHWPSMCEVLSSKPYSVIKRGGGGKEKKCISIPKTFSSICSGFIYS